MLKFKEMDDKKKRMVIIVSVLVVFIGISFAYVVAQISGSAIGNANITADTSDNLDFSIDKDINLNPTQFNVTEGGGGLSDTATGTASLLANSTNDTAEYTYYVYFNIKYNNYTYTTEDNKPEIVLTITDPTGQPVTEVSGLTYVTAQNADGTTVSGFDITTKSGLYNIISNYEITSNSSTNATEQDWVFTVTFINLTTNQSENGGSTLDAEIILSKDEKNYHEICEPGTMACDIARLYNEENPESNGLYYHNGTIIDENEVCVYEGNQVLSFPDGTPSTNAEDCNTVYSFAGMYYDASVITGDIAEDMVEEVTWDSANSVCETTSGIPVYNDNKAAVSQELCSGYAAMMSDTEAVIMINVGSGTMEPPILDAKDYSYRYSGANPNNYVCFGSNEGTCLNDNLYRIIGVFNGQVKLIKADYTRSDMLGTDGRDYFGTYDSNTTNYKGSMDTSTIAGYRWNYDTNVSTYGSNNWTTSEFNTINLNTNYWNYLGTTWQNLIAETTWHLGGMTSNGNTAKAFYDGERNNAGYGSNPTTYTDEIGLMYPSDYGYAASPDAWTTILFGYSNSTIKANNWLYMGLIEWTITPRSSLGYGVFTVSLSGYLYYSSASFGYAARPVFYLESNVQLEGGTGTSSDPYRLAV